MNFLKLVEEARSCRRFIESEPLSVADLEWLVNCARLVPSARNAQVLRYILVNSGSVLEKLFPLTRWAGALKNWGGPYPGERPTAFIATLMPEKGGDLICIDVGIACQTIQLAATSRNWGACMIYSFQRDEAATLLNVPSDMKIALLIGLGAARETRKIADIPADGSTAYWRDEQGVHYVPKRKLEDIILARY